MSRSERSKRNCKNTILNLEHENRVPRAPAPPSVEVLQGRFDKGKVHGPGEFGQEVGAPTQQLVVDEVAKEGTVGAAGLVHKASGK